MALLAALACSKTPSARQGPVIAEGDGITVTAGEIKARLAEAPPAVRFAFRNLDGKKQFLDDLIRFELVARTAENEGLVHDPSVQLALKRALVARHYQRFLQQQAGAERVPQADIRKYYDEHRDDFSRPERVHAALVFLAAEEGSSDRAAKEGQAKKLLARILAGEPKNPDAFSVAARESSDDPTTKPLGGDLGFRTREELVVYGKELAEAAFKLGVNQTSPSVIETPRGLYLLRVMERQAGETRGLDDVKAQIAARLASQRADDAYEQLLRSLRDGAKIRINDSELEKVTTAGLPGAGG
jgi:peptidyl-prolyl cis-trans isomerase C